MCLDLSNRYETRTIAEIYQHPVLCKRTKIAAMSRYRNPFFLAVIVLGLILVSVFLPVRDWLTTGIIWINANHSAAWVIFILTYALAPIFLIPGTILTLAAGFAFGLPMGVLLVSIGSLLGAVNAFLIGRFFARDWVSQYLARTPTFGALDDAIHDHGFLIVLLTRLSPLIPFNALNYILGLTKIGFKNYFLATWIGMLPATLAYTYAGSVTKDIFAITTGASQKSTADYILILLGLISTVVLVIFLTQKAKRILNEHLQLHNTKSGTI